MIKLEHLFLVLILLPLKLSASDPLIDLNQVFDLREPEFSRGKLLGDVSGNIMEVGNKFSLSFDLKLKSAYWKQKNRVKLDPIVTLAPARYDFVYGGAETVQVALGRDGIALMTHYKGYVRISRLEHWKILPKRLNRWHRISIDCSGFGGLILSVDGKEAMIIEDFGTRSWADRSNFGSGWAFRSHGEAHKLWLSSPNIKPAAVIIKDLQLSGGRPYIQVQ